MSKQTARFLVTGYAGSGKSTFIRTICQVVAIDGNWGELDINDKLKIELVAAAAPSESEAWREYIERVIGVVMIVDGTQPQSFPDVPKLIETIEAEKVIPFIIAVNKQDCAGWQPPTALLQHLPEDTDIKVFPCKATDSNSAQNVLLALIYSILG
jgi:uncharacterized protein